MRWAGALITAFVCFVVMWMLLVVGWFGGFVPLILTLTLAPALVGYVVGARTSGRTVLVAGLVGLFVGAASRLAPSLEWIAVFGGVAVLFYGIGIVLGRRGRRRRRPCLPEAHRGARPPGSRAGSAPSRAGTPSLPRCRRLTICDLAHRGVAAPRSGPASCPSRSREVAIAKRHRVDCSRAGPWDEVAAAPGRHRDWYRMESRPVIFDVADRGGRTSPSAAARSCCSPVSAPPGRS